MNSAIIPREGNLTAIISAELSWRDAGRNHLDHLELRDRLARQLAIGELHGMFECEGAYKGTPEKSIAITGPLETVKAIATREGERFGQESVLYVTNSGRGTLRYIGHGTGPIQLEAIGLYTPLRGTADAWTRVIATGETFTFD